MNYLDLSELMPKLSKAVNVIKEVFTAEATREQAHQAAVVKTMELIRHYAADFPPAEITEKVETQFKALGVWPLNLNKTSETEVVYLGVVQAKQISLAAKIRERVYNLIHVKGVKNILSEDGLLQFHTVGDRVYIQNDRNTTPDGQYTTGKDKGGQKSQADIAKEATGTGSNPRQNTGPSEEADAEQAKKAREARQLMERIAQTFGHANEALLAEHRILESMRAKLAKSAAGKEYLAAVTPLAEVSIQNMENLADHLHIVVKTVDGKPQYTIKSKS